MRVRFLVVSHVQPRAELGVRTARAHIIGCKAEEIKQPSLLYRLGDLTLLCPEGGRVLFALSALRRTSPKETGPTLLVPCQPMNSSLSRPNRCLTASYARLKNGRWILDLDLGFAEMGHWRIMVSQ